MPDSATSIINCLRALKAVNNVRRCALARNIGANFWRVCPGPYGLMESGFQAEQVDELTDAKANSM